MTICDYLLPVNWLYNHLCKKSCRLSWSHHRKRNMHFAKKKKHEYSISRSTLHSDIERQVRGTGAVKGDFRSGRWWAQVVFNWKDRIPNSIKTGPGLHRGNSIHPDLLTKPPSPPPPPGALQGMFFISPTPSRCLHFTRLDQSCSFLSSQSKKQKKTKKCLNVQVTAGAEWAL